MQKWRGVYIQILGGFLLNYVVPVEVIGKLIGLVIGVTGLGNLAVCVVSEAKRTTTVKLLYWLFVMIVWTGLLIAYAVAGLIVQKIMFELLVENRVS